MKPISLDRQAERKKKKPITSAMMSKICNKSYEGERSEGKRHGKGNCTFDKEGSSYEGDWDNDTATGVGKVEFSNGDVYDGGIVNGSMEGVGTYEFATGDHFFGDWSDGHRIQGTVMFADGNTYIGEFRKDKPHGKGKFTFVTGDSYDGQYEVGKPHGRGLYTFPNGSTYRGEFNHGKLEGFGTMTLISGDQITGKFMDGMSVGKCFITRANGQQYPHCCNGQPVRAADMETCV